MLESAEDPLDVLPAEDPPAEASGQEQVGREEEVFLLLCA